jgi:hypothetical protein
MPALLTSSSVMKCPHGGTVNAIPGQTRALAGDPILRGSDTCLIAGCPFVQGTTPSPCVRVQWLTTATRVRAGDPVLNESSVGLCLAATNAPQGTVLIVTTQQRGAGL